MRRNTRLRLPHRLAPGILSTLGLLLTLGVGCGDLLTFDLATDIDEFTIPGDPYLHHDEAPLDKLDIPPVEVRFETLDGGEVTISGLSFFVTSSAQSSASDDDSLSFVDRLAVYAVPTSGTDLPPVVVATWIGPAERGDSEIRCTVDRDVNLSRYIAAGMEFVVKADGIVPYDDVTLDGVATFRVDPL
ncbi:MAG: hypothetical protein ACI9WU_002761 [Myxococcota bacterium]|jgi:hypothetical protein